MKLKTQKITFISLILIICIISYIGYKFPNFLPICFQLSIITATFLSINLSWICPPLNHSPRTQVSSMRFLIACVAAIAILIIYIGIVGYFLWHHPLSSITEPINCFIVIWGIATFTFSTLTLFSSTFKKIYK